MSQPAARIGRRSFPARTLLPVSIPLGAMLLLTVATRNAGWIEDPGLYRLWMNGGHVLIYLAYAASTLVLYPVMVFRGASLAERILGCYVATLAYLLKEIIRVNEYFSLGESLYYGLSSIMLGGLVLQVGYLALGELISRALYRWRVDPTTRVVTWPALLGIAFALVSLYVLLIWDGGVHYFYLYQEGYKLLFQ
jgi:hypothetical protein